MNQRALAAVVLLTALALAPAQAQAAARSGDENESSTGGTVGSFGLQQTTRRADRPPSDPVGGFQIAIMGGVQMRGSASGHVGVAFSYFKRSTGNVGIELEAAVSRGPNGQINHGLLSLIFQSGGRSSKLAPYLAVGGGVYHANESLRGRVADALPIFGIEPKEELETGALIAFGLGFRFYLSESVSFRADYREMRAITTGSGNLFDRIFSLRRIGGFLAFQL